MGCCSNDYKEVHFMNNKTIKQSNAKDGRNVVAVTVDSKKRKVVDIMNNKNSSRDNGMMQVLGSSHENLALRDYVLPKSICTLVNKILDVRKSDIVAEINCSTGCYLENTIKEYPEIKLVGVEKEFEKLEQASLALGHYVDTRDIHNSYMREFVLREVPTYEHQINLLCANPFYYFNGNAAKKLYDKVFTYMSERIMLRNERAFGEYIRDSKLYHTVRYHSSSDWYFNEMLIESIKQNGKAVALMNSGAMNNKVDEDSRKFFVENGYIEAVIKLPERLALSMRSSVIVVLSNGNQAVRFVDASSYYVEGRRSNELSEENIDAIIKMLQHDDVTSKMVVLEKVGQAGFVLNPESYLIDEVDMKNRISLGDVLKTVKRAVPLKAAVLDEASATEETAVKYIRLADLQDGVISDELCCLKKMEPKWDKYVLDNHDLVISKITKPCKMAVYTKSDDKSVVMVGNMYALTVDDKKINPYYLQAYLESDQGAAALNACSTGSTLAIISIDALKNLQVPVPPMEIQNMIAERCAKLLRDIKLHKRMLNKAIEELGKVYEVE